MWYRTTKQIDGALLQTQVSFSQNVLNSPIPKSCYIGLVLPCSVSDSLFKHRFVTLLQGNTLWTATSHSHQTQLPDHGGFIFFSQPTLKTSSQLKTVGMGSEQENHALHRSVLRCRRTCGHVETTHPGKEISDSKLTRRARAANSTHSHQVCSHLIFFVFQFNHWQLWRHSY